MEKWRFKHCLKILIVAQIFLFYILSSMDIDLKIILMILIMPILILILTYFFTNINRIKYDGYYNNLEDMYTPAIVSYLLDQIIGKADVLATILDLIVRKYLRIEKNDNKFNINILNKKDDDLYEHEKFLIECLNERKKIDIQKFKKYIIRDCEKNELIYRKKSIVIDIVLKIILVLEIIGTLLLLPALVIPVLIYIPFIPLSIAFIVRFYIKKYKKRAKGIEVVAKSKMLKNFLRDYTLLKEKKCEHITVIERYIPYAMVLDEADKIEGIVEKDSMLKKLMLDDSIFDILFDY